MAQRAERKEQRAESREHGAADREIKTKMQVTGIEHGAQNRTI